MATGRSPNLNLALPVQGELDGTWGDMVNNGITTYTDIAIAGTLTLTGDGAVTLTTTTGDSSATNVGLTTAQYAVIKVASTTTTKTITAPASSKTYTVINTSSNPVVFKAAGQTGVTVAAGASAYVAFNGTDFVQIGATGSGTVTSVGATVPSFLSVAGSPITTSGTLALSYSGTALPVANGGTGVTATPTNGQLLIGNGTGFALGTLTAGTNVTITNTAGGITIAATPGGGGSGTVTSVGMTVPAFLTVTGSPITSSGTLAVDYSGTALPITNGGTGATSAAAALTSLGAASATGAQTLTNKTIEAGVFTNGYTEETVAASTGTAYTIALANGTVQILTLTGNCTFTFPTATAGQSFMIILRQDATGGRTVTWPGTVKWPNATAPTITSTASKSDKFVFTADGTSWLGSVAGQAYA